MPSRETFVTTAMCALFLALGESKTLVRGLEAWQHDLDRSALKLAPLPSAVLLAASRLPRSPPSIRDAWAFFLRTVFSDKDCAKYCSLTLTPTLTFDMVVDVPANVLVVDVPRIVSQAVPELGDSGHPNTQVSSSIRTHTGVSDDNCEERTCNSANDLADAVQNASWPLKWPQGGCRPSDKRAQHESMGARRPEADRASAP